MASHVCMYIYALGVCVCVCTGNTCSDLLLAGPGGTELTSLSAIGLLDAATLYVGVALLLIQPCGESA